MSNAKILIVEDMANEAEAISIHVREMGYDICSVVSTGEAAIEEIQKKMPDLVLLDIILEGKMNGIETAREINTRFRIPVIFLTGHIDSPLVEQAKLTEPFGYLVKPYEAEELNANIEMALHKSKTETSLRKSEKKYRQLVETLNEGIWVVDDKGKTTYTNPYLEKLLGYTGKAFNGKVITGFMDQASGKKWRNHFKDKETFGKKPMDFTLIHKDKTPVYTRFNITQVTDEDGNNYEAIISVVDMTAQKKAENWLKEAQAELEKRVEERTEELKKTNDQLEREVQERKLAEKDLKKREKELKELSRHLKEVNTALNVLLKRRAQDKDELEENILSNVKELIGPYISKLRKSNLESYQSTILSIIETNLNEIVSPFTRTLSSQYSNFTPMEIRVANLVRQGKTNKETAKLLGISLNTVLTHRFNLRKKLGLKNTKINLRSHLMSLGK